MFNSYHRLKAEEVCGNAIVLMDAEYKLNQKNATKLGLPKETIILREIIDNKGTQYFAAIKTEKQGYDYVDTITGWDVRYLRTEWTQEIILLKDKRKGKKKINFLEKVLNKK